MVESSYESTLLYTIANSSHRTHSPRQECNARSGVTHANTLPNMPPEDNCMFKGITTSSTVPDKAIINIDMQLKDIDRELSKFDS